MDPAALAGTTLFADDFADGLARWQVRPLGDRPGGDGRVTTSPDGLVVAPPGLDPGTGEPRFADATGGPHLRWAALAAHTSSRGLPGFDTAPHGLVVAAELSARVFGLGPLAAGHDGDHERDVRLGAAALITLDRETGVVFDVMVTQRAVVAVYERLPAAGGTAVFSYAVPVADRRPDEAHRVAVAYDPGSSQVVWHVDGAEALRIDAPGRRCLPSRYLVRDDGGPDGDAAPAQLTAGLGLLADETLGQGVRLRVRSVEVRAGTRLPLA